MLLECSALQSVRARYAHLFASPHMVKVYNVADRPAWLSPFLLHEMQLMLTVNA